MAETGLHPQAGVSDEVRTPMCSMHGEPIEFYCQTHKNPACGTCKLMSHRKCQLQDLERAAAGSNGRNLEVLQQLRVAEADMKRIGEIMGNEMEGLTAQKDVAIDKIKRQMKAVEALGEKRIVEVEEKFKQEREGMEREACAIKKSTMLVEKSFKELERASNIGSEEEVFLATKQAEDDVAKFHDIVRESSRHVDHTEMYFEEDDRLTHITSIGKVKVEKTPLVVDCVLTSETTEVLNTHIEDGGIYITWFDMLPSGQMLLLGVVDEVSQLSLYSGNKLVSELDMLTRTYCESAAMMHAHQLILALPASQTLQIVNIDKHNNHLTKGSTIKTDQHPCLILKYSDCSVLVLKKSRGSNFKCCFQILDLSGKVEKSFKPSKDMQNPGFMRMSHARNAIYMVDVLEGCLGFNMQGDMIFHYDNTEYGHYAGLAVDPHGDLHLSATGNRGKYLTRLLKLKPTGQLIRQVDTRGTIRPLQCIRNKIYVRSCNDQNEEIITYVCV